MSMIFQLRMIGTEDEEFLREYELSYATSLLDFHRFICDDLKYDPGSMSSFFLSNERWEQGKEFTAADMGAGESEFAPIPMEKATLGQVLHRNHDRLVYVFDPFDGRSLFLELMGTVKQRDGMNYPRIAMSVGEAPEQFSLDVLASLEDDSVFEDAMDRFHDFYDDEF